MKPKTNYEITLVNSIVSTNKTRVYMRKTDGELCVAENVYRIVDGQLEHIGMLNGTDIECTYINNLTFQELDEYSENDLPFEYFGEL